MIDEATVRTTIAEHKIIDAVSCAIAEQVMRQYGYNHNEFVGSLKIDLDYVRFEVRDDDGYSNYVVTDLSFPTWYIWKPDYQDHLIEAQKEFAAKKEREKIAAQAAAKAEQDARDLQTYLILQAKLKNKGIV